MPITILPDFGKNELDSRTAIEWLALSGIVTRIHRIEHPIKPLENYRDIDAFKIYVSDVGLLCAKNDVIAEDVLYQPSDLADFKGGMTENYVCGQLITRFPWGVSQRCF